MKIDVKNIAKLANLKPTSGEEQKFETQLGDILTYVEQLQKIDTAGIEETAQVTGLSNISRNDTTSPSLSQGEALSGAKEQHNGFVKVQAILDSE
jgi:aspartyl-tRNA(Asn)/glutamyl-tRNA(Gln) amidotransferase subunit C